MADSLPSRAGHGGASRFLEINCWFIFMLNCKINGTVHIFFLKKYCSAPGERNCPNFFSRGVFPLYYHAISDFCHIWGPFMAPWSKKSYMSDFSINIWYLYIDGKIRKVWFFAPGCLNNFTQGWSFSVILAWDNQKGTFLTHFFNFGHEGAPNVTKITYNMIIWWENSPRKKNWGSFVHRGLSNTFKKKKIWTVPLILQFNIWTHF